MKGKKNISTIVIYLLISLLGLVMLYPLIWMIFAALKPSKEVLSNSSLLPSEFRFDNFPAGWKLVRPYTFDKFFINTFALVITCVICSLAISLFVGYAFARVNFHFKAFWYSVMRQRKLMAALPWVLS